MSLASFEVFTAGSYVATLSTNVITPIMGSGSGRILNGSAPAGVCTLIANVTTASGRSQGVTRGKLRSIFRYPEFSGISENRIGFTCLQSQNNIASLASNFYFGGIVALDGSPIKLCIDKTTTSTFGVGETTFVSVPFSPGVNVVWTLEFEWIADLVELGGTALFLRQGYATDFSDLVTVLSYLDVTAPFTSSVSESIAWTRNYTGSLVDFDQTSLFIP